MNMRQHGFTLVEIVCVLVIMGLISIGFINGVVLLMQIRSQHNDLMENIPITDSEIMQMKQALRTEYCSTSVALPQECRYLDQEKQLLSCEVESQGFIVAKMCHHATSVAPVTSSGGDQ